MNLQIKITLLFIVAIFASINQIVGQTNTESLIHLFKTEKNEEARIILLDSIHSILEKVDKEEALKEWDNLIDLSTKLDYKLETGCCNYYKALMLKNAGEYFPAYISYEQSRSIFENIPYKTGLAKVNNGLGILYKELINYEKSLAHYRESAKLFTELKDSVRVGWIYLNIGGMWEKQDSLPQAMKYLRMSQKLLEKLEDPNIISCYINLGEVFNKESKYDSAYYYYIKSYLLSKISGNSEDKFQAPFHLGKFLFTQNRISEATPIILEMMELTQNPKFKNLIKIDDRSDIARLLSQFYAQKGDYKNAFDLLNESTNYALDYKREESIRDLHRFEIANLENESMRARERGLQEHKRRMWTTYISIVGLLASILLMFSFYRSYKHKKEANRLLTEMDELKNRFYSNITHELRTPLTLILGPLEQMLSGETDKMPSRKLVKMMRKNANSLLNLVNQMLDLSKINAKNMKLELIEDDINKFLRSRFAAFASLIEQKSITYHYSLLKDKNIRIFDATKLEKIINNLLSNAIKFTPKNGKIDCYANFLHPNTLKLIVQDNGKGIPKEELDLIFERFHQVQPNNGIPTTGTGIGLSLTSELVELMHGKIEVKSEVGKGTAFTITIPLGTEHLISDEFQLVQNLSTKINSPIGISKEIDVPGNQSNGKNSTSKTQKLPHVLVVEDNNDIREFITENLNDHFVVDQSKNGKAGLKHATTNIPDLVITDVVMPKMDGIELCDQIKNDERTSHIPVIILTGKSSMDDRLKGLKTGADAYLTKPFNIEELKLLVTKLIEQRQKLRERFTSNLRFEPKDVAVTSVDEKFISRAMEIIEKNMGNSEFEVRQFQNEMFMSRMQLFRKIKALTNQTPGEFIRTIRLKRAASLIKQNFGNIAQITFEVGFNNPSYFAKCFKDLFGELPSDYMKTHHSEG